MLEPLLWEIIRSERVRRIVLVGTAGSLPEFSGKLGAAYLISQAFLAGTALDEEQIPQPLRPMFGSDICMATIPKATIVSTDFYYGFAGKEKRPEYPPIMQRVENRFAAINGVVDLVDMETAQFYYFCGVFQGSRPMEFVAVKGPANPIINVQVQVEHSKNVLRESLKVAIALLGGGFSMTGIGAS
jgi:hypothetical protein